METKNVILRIRDTASLLEWRSGLFKWLYLAMISPGTDEKERENVFYYYELINEILEKIVFSDSHSKK